MELDELRLKVVGYVRGDGTQTNISKATGVPQSTISTFMQGSGISTKNYFKLVKFFKG